MTEVKKVTWSGVILAVAFVAGLGLLYSPASALDAMFFAGPDTIHVGDSTHVEVNADDVADDWFAIFTITPSGPTGGAAVFINGTDSLTCVNDDDADDLFDDFPFVGCDQDSSDDDIEVEVIGTSPGQVAVCAEGHEGASGGGDLTDGENPRCLILTIEGSGGGILTLTSDKASIGRPNEIGGWTGPGSPFNIAKITAHLTTETVPALNVPGADVDFNTISPSAPNNLQLNDDDTDDPTAIGGTWTHGGQGCTTDASGTCHIWARATNSSEYGPHVIIGVVDGAVDAAGTVSIIVAKPPANVAWDLDDPQGTSTIGEVVLTITDVDGRIAWTGLGIVYDEGDGSFAWLVCPQGVNVNKLGMASCSYLSPGMAQDIILGVNVGSGLVSTYVLTIVSGGTPESGAFNPVPVAGGLTITTYTGTLAALVADGAELNLVSCFATVGGNFIGHIFGAPAFVNSAFNTHFAGGLSEQGLICRRA